MKYIQQRNQFEWNENGIKMDKKLCEIKLSITLTANSQQNSYYKMKWNKINT